MGFGGISIWSLLLIASILVLILIPLLVFVPAVRKTGFSGWWALLVYVPLVNIVMFWVLAFVEWPTEKA